MSSNTIIKVDKNVHKDLNILKAIGSHNSISDLIKDMIYIYQYRIDYIKKDIKVVPKR